MPPLPGRRPSVDPDLALLVGRTTGLQPWRRLFHAGCGLAVAVALHFLEPGRLVAGSILGALATGLLISDLLRLRLPALNRLFFRVFRPFASPREAGGVASSTWFVTGCAVTAGVFPGTVAVPAILVLAVADPLASYVGRRWGRRPWGAGSVEGSLVFLAGALLVLVPTTGPAVGIPTALAMTWIERTPWPLDDNLTVPVGTAVLLSAAAFLLA